MSDGLDGVRVVWCGGGLVAAQEVDVVIWSEGK